MKRLWTNLPQFLRTTSWRATTCASLCLTPVGLFMVSCTDTTNTKQVHALHHTPEMMLKPLPTLSTPNEGVLQGQQNALLNFMARKWQLKSINHIPVDNEVIIDLSDFANAKGHAHTDCDEIYFELNTHKVLANKLSTITIERKMTDCTHDMGDNIMRILGDLHSFSHQNNTLTLISLKDKIQLVALN